MNSQERFATWGEVEILLQDVQIHLGVDRLIYGLDETQAALIELGKSEEFRELVFAISHPRWNDPLEKKLVFLARIDREKVVRAMANAMNPRG